MSPSDADMAECCICMCTYDRAERAPISINCGHTFCKSCIPRFINDQKLSCPVCRTVSIVGDSGFQKNLALIQALEKLKLIESDDNKENSAPNVKKVKKGELPCTNCQEQRRQPQQQPQQQHQLQQQQQRVDNESASDNGNWVRGGRWVRFTDPIQWVFVQEYVPTQIHRATPPSRRYPVNEWLQTRSLPDSSNDREGVVGTVHRNGNRALLRNNGGRLPRNGNVLVTPETPIPERGNATTECNDRYELQV